MTRKMNIANRTESLENSSLISFKNEEDGQTRAKVTKTQNGSLRIDGNFGNNGNDETEEYYQYKVLTPDSDYKSEDSRFYNDLEGSANLHDDNSLSGSWTQGVRMPGLLAHNAAWPLAEGSLRLKIDLDNSCETSSNYVHKSDKSVKLNPDDFKDDEENKKEDDKSNFSFRTLTRNQKVILIATSITNLLSFLSLSILAPFFPLEADKKNVNGTISGWIFGIFALVQFMTSPLFGRLIPIVGSKFMYVAGLFVTCGCTFLFGVLDLVPFQDGVTLYISLCFLVRVMLALGCTALSNAGFVMLVKAFPDHVATVFGIGEIFTGIGMVAGPAMGGFLYSAGGFVLPFAVIGGCCLVALPVIWLALPTPDDSTEGQSDDLSIKKLILNPRSIINSLTIMIAASIWAILDPTLEPHLRVYGFGPEIVGVLFLIMAAVYSVTSPMWGSLADRLSDNRILLIPGFVVAAIGLLLLGPSPALGFALSYNELWLTIVSLVILGLASSLVVIPTYDIYIDILADIDYPEDTRTYGMVSGLWVSMYALGHIAWAGAPNNGFLVYLAPVPLLDFAGPSLGGFLNDEVGFEWMATGVACCCLAMSLIVSVSWFIEAKCCQRETIQIYGQTSERTPLLVSTTSNITSNSMDSDLLKSYPSGNSKTTPNTSAF